MNEFQYPDQLEIRPFAGALSATVSVPGSKSITNRALVLAALASREGPCELTGALRSEDTEVMVDSLQRLGFKVEADWGHEIIRVGKNESGRVIPAESAELFVANSGTSMRFLTAMVSLGAGKYRLDGIPRMRERPIQNLLDALNQVPGVTTISEPGTGCPPVHVSSLGWLTRDRLDLNIRADVSSQYLSAILMAAAFAPGETWVHLEGNVVSEPYVRMTDCMLDQWGITVLFHNPGGANSLEVQGGWHTRPPSAYAIEPDASAASYFWAAAAITGGRVTLLGLNRYPPQGDLRFVNVLEQMGCQVEECEAGITVHGRPLRGIDVDMNAISDTVMTLGAVACFAEAPTRIRNVAHIRHKETDRIAALATELRRLGAEVEEFGDGLTITPRPLHGAAVETYNDHRMAMSLALIGLKVPGVVIKNPGCVAKTYPGFWQDLDRLVS